jgi:hypothetical protein
MITETDSPLSAGLPDAPLAMPKQILENPRSWLVALREMLFGVLVRS